MGLYRRGSIYWIDYYNGTKRVREPVGTKEEARVALGKRLEDRRQGRNPETRRLRPIPFSSAAVRFMAEYVERTSRRPATFQVRLNPLKAHFGETPLGAITRSEVNRYVNARRAEKSKRGEGTISDSTINRELAFLSRLFTWAHDEAEIFGGENPCRRFRLDEPEPREDNFLTPAQADKLIEVAEDHLKPIIVFCLGTSARIGETLALKWSAVDLTPGAERVWFDAETTKAHKTRTVPLTPDVIAMLRDRRRVRFIADDRVFTFRGRPIGRILRTFKTAVRRAGLPVWVTPHTLRHTAATWFRQNGGDLFRLQELMGHADIKLTQRYAKVSPEYQRENLGFMGRPKPATVKSIGHKSVTNSGNAAGELAS